MCTLNKHELNKKENNVLILRSGKQNKQTNKQTTTKTNKQTNKKLPKYFMLACAVVCTKKQLKKTTIAYITLFQIIVSNR